MICDKGSKCFAAVGIALLLAGCEAGSSTSGDVWYDPYSWWDDEPDVIVVNHHDRPDRPHRPDHPDRPIDPDHRPHLPDGPHNGGGLHPGGGGHIGGGGHLGGGGHIGGGGLRR